MAAALLFAIPVISLSQSPEDRERGSVSDSIKEQQRDSMLFSLNLEYLNGVNEHCAPYELIPIIEEILALDPGLYHNWFNLGMEYIKIKEY